METIRDWKSYQSILNRKRRKNKAFLSYVKLTGILIFTAFIIFFSYRLFNFGKSYLIKRNKLSHGTGIRSISFETGGGSASGSGGGNNKKPGISQIFSAAGFSASSLKKYFKYYSPDFSVIKNGHYIQKVDGYTIVYTLIPSLQKEAEKVFREYTVPFGVVAAVNPETGAVLALSSYSIDKDKSSEISALNPYPPGSLVKIITASAAIESRGFYPGFDICFNGGLYGTNKAYWKQNIYTGSNRLPLGLAFAKSCDIAFGKVAGFYVGKKLLGSYFEKFYFNKRVPFILNLGKSSVKMPDSFYSLELTGAGFKNVKATPLQEALIVASIVNKGKFLDPYIIQKIISPSGKVIFRHKGVVMLDNPITSGTALLLKRMMIETITKGVGHPDFFNRSGRYLLPGITTGGKTGTIHGGHPTGLYQWFAGFGEENNKKIALSALIVQKPKWKIGGGGVAEKLMLSFFFRENP